jgi:hypothetical protein
VNHVAPTPLFDDAVAALHDSSESTQDISVVPDAADRVIDPDSAGGAAIIDLFARIKDKEDGDGEWGADCIQEICLWLLDLGIDPDGTLDKAVNAMRTAAEPHGALRLPGFIVRVVSGQPDAAAVLTTAVTVLTRQLGDDAAAVLSTRDGDVLARFGGLGRPDATDAGT